MVVSSRRYAWPTAGSAPLIPMRMPLSGMLPGIAVLSRLTNFGLVNR
jgi:hypothetical protein